MFKNNFKIAWRNLWKHKLFSTINIISLAIGFSASFVIGLMVYYDLTFDKFHQDSELIFRITSNYSSPERESGNSGIAVPLIAEAKNNISGISTATGIHAAYFQKVEESESKTIFRNPENTVFTDKEYFEIFKYEWLAGSPNTAFNSPNQVVLTENRAALYFPNLNPNEIIGKGLVYNDSIPTKVTGIVANLQERTDLIFEEFYSLGTSKKTNNGDAILNPQWDNTSSRDQLFIKVSSLAVLPSINKQLADIAEAQRSDFEKAFNRKRSFYLQPLSDLHFNQKYNIFNFSQRPANTSVMFGLGCVALFLLLLGCINFINLNTAQANQRAKEIGIRKTLGSSKKQLIYQFMGETFMLTLTAALVSVVLAYWLLDIFSDFTPQGLEFALFKDPFIVSCAIILVVLVTLLSGIYPSLVLTHYKPVSVLKNQVLNTSGKPALRRFLTVFQFSIAQLFIISTILVSKQIHFMLNKDMGISTESIAYVETPWYSNTLDKEIRFEEQLKSLPDLKAIARGGASPASFNMNSTVVTYINGDNEIQSPIQIINGGKDYIELYDIELLAGRVPLNDTIREYVINETFLNIIGFKDPNKAIGEQVKRGDQMYPIVGVVKDFNQRSLKDPIEPLAIAGDWNQSSFGVLHFTLTNEHGNMSSTIAKIESIYKSIYPEADFELTFMDETVERFYTQERSLSKLLNWAMGLSVLISCLGLLGLVIYTTERRTKEIGIRKVLGASIAQLNVMLCKEFLMLVGIAFVIAAPLAYYGMDNWLNNYAFKTNLSWWIFALSGFGMVLIAISIMSARTVSTALKNPVNSLRTE